ncbi:MAG: hypothetical protein U5J95_02485 [Balneolaceae bacterium]|nr:hypothetical protein [Balneolaceae bacterium]
MILLSLEPILTSLYSVILFIVNGVLHFLSLQITVWAILVFLTLLFLASRPVDKLTAENVPEPPEFTNYTEDQISSMAVEVDLGVGFL